MKNDNAIKNKSGMEWIKLDPKIQMSDLVVQYPELVQTLTEDYGLHCVNCMLNDFDTLEEGALLHGIEGEDFEEMVENLEDIINGEVEAD